MTSELCKANILSKTDVLLRDDLPWTARAETPVFSIRLASSTVSWDDFKSRILHVTGTSKFLFSIIKIWNEEVKCPRVNQALSRWNEEISPRICEAYIMNELRLRQQCSTHASTHRKRFGAAHINIYCSNIFTPRTRNSP